MFIHRNFIEKSKHYFIPVFHKYPLTQHKPFTYFHPITHLPFPLSPPPRLLYTEHVDLESELREMKSESMNNQLCKYL